MKVNMLIADRMIRVVIAFLLIGLYAAGVITGGLGIGLFVAGVYFILTGMFGFCPIYWSFGF